MMGGMEVKGKRIRRWISVVLLLTFLCTTVMTTNAQENSGDLETYGEENIENPENDTYDVSDDLNQDDTERNDNSEDGNVEVTGEPSGDSDSEISEDKDEQEQQTNEASGVESTPEVSLDGSNNAENNEMQSDEKSSDISVKYKAHVSNLGWQESVSNGETSGTVGKNLPMEAITIELEGTDAESLEDAGIEYEVHVSDLGWQKVVRNGSIGGTTGKAKAMEAIRISLTGQIAQSYDVYYRVHSAEYGWFDWAKNGETAGSVGFSYAMQAIEIKLYPKNSPEAPVTVGKTYLAEDNMGDVIYQVHVQDKGWEAKKIDGQEAGNSAENKNLEAIKINISEFARQYGELTGSIEYETHVRDIGWQDPVQDGQIAGTTGKNKPIEAIRIRLTGQLNDVYEVYYRVYVENKGWMGWATDGNDAGSIGFAYSAKAIEIRLCKPDSSNIPEMTAPACLNEDNMGMVIYNAHVQNVGWQKKVTDGATAGTTGKGLGIEALTISITDFWRDDTLAGSVFYRAHVSDIGWTDEVSDGEVAGTTGQDRRIEAIAIRLTDQLAQKYDIFYRVHSSNFGWLNWTSNGNNAGSTGYGSPIEAVQIKICENGSQAKPSGEGRAFLSREQISNISIQPSIETSGLLEAADGKEFVAGTIGQARGIKTIAMAVKPSADTYTGGISYNAHLTDIGWQGWISDGNVAGSLEPGKKIEAIQIKLTGEMGTYCDIYYRVHVENFGWLGWTKNGIEAGTTGYAYKIEAIEVKIMPKYTASPVPLGNSLKKAPPRDVMQMMQMANLYGSNTPFLLLVNRSTHKVGVFQGWQGNWNNIAYWDCSDGAPSTPTVEGVFRVGSKGHYFDSGSSRCYWYTQFYGNYLFHSVLYSKYNGALVDGRLGMALSHGCVRLDINNAKWIYDNIPPGTTVVVYH